MSTFHIVYVDIEQHLARGNQGPSSPEAACAPPAAAPPSGVDHWTRRGSLDMDVWGDGFVAKIKPMIPCGARSLSTSPLLALRATCPRPTHHDHVPFTDSVAFAQVSAEGAGRSRGNTPATEVTDVE